ncbi:MAG: Gfo/Idh/MocA family oxidoreductase [Verrucomicrobia bacterium]|nr:Gfo/Idh/MocA family oxidoreductase [Verrucomicrobiota bacterium]MDA1065818.1 Gfo/Idh/MocA family oxidoreductase [Verrucomicrobiota bacterium]
MNRRDFIISTAGAVLATPLVSQTVSKKSKIRIGQIGTKHAHASGKIQAVLSQPENFDVVGVVEPDEVRRVEMSKNNAYRDVTWLSEEQLLNSPGLQAVAIETEVADLVSTAARAISAGFHIHHDKPGGDSFPEFRELLKQAERGNRIVQMGYMLRYNPAFQFMYRAVKDGWLGEIMEVDCMMGKLASTQTRIDIGQFPGGGMFELGGHVIDSIIHMLGKPDSVTPYTRKTKSDGVADNQLAVLEFGKATATVRINHNDPFGSPRRRFQISGDKGSIEIQQLESGNLTLYLDEPRGIYKQGVQEVKLPITGGRYDEEFADLSKVIRGVKKLAWSYSHDLNTQEALLLASDMPVG